MQQEARNLLLLLLLLKVHPRTSHEVPEGEYLYGSTRSLTAGLEAWLVKARPRPLYPRVRPSTHCVGGWLGPRAFLDGCRKSRPHWDSIPEQSSP